MIFIDGDSVALATRTDVYPHQTWWGLLPQKTTVLATPSATMGDCLSRLPMTEEARPDLYILMAGQWSHNHEPIAEFEKYMEEIAARITKLGIQMMLVTPPFPKVEFAPILPFVSAIRSCANRYGGTGVQLVDLYWRMETLDIYGTNNIHLGVAGNRMLADMVRLKIETE